MKTSKFFIVLILVLVSNIAFAAGKVTLTIKPPVHDGGSRLMIYYVEYREIHEKDWWKNGTVPVPMVGGKYVDMPYTVQGLIEGNTYIFRVRVENYYGTGEPGSPSKKVTVTSEDLSGIEVQSGPGFNKPGRVNSSVLSNVSSTNQIRATGVLYKKEED